MRLATYKSIADRNTLVHYSLTETYSSKFNYFTLSVRPSFWQGTLFDRLPRVCQITRPY